MNAKTQSLTNLYARPGSAFTVAHRALLPTDNDQRVQAIGGATYGVSDSAYVFCLINSLGSSVIRTIEHLFCLCYNVAQQFKFYAYVRLSLSSPFLGISGNGGRTFLFFRHFSGGFMSEKTAMVHARVAQRHLTRLDEFARATGLNHSQIIRTLIERAEVQPVYIGTSVQAGQLKPEHRRA
ncbi:MAG: hypothetical protein U0350_06005 [Caldilineaceae bacterium]